MAPAITVLSLVSGPGALDYRAPDGLALAPGDIVEVPLGARHVVGVVWDEGVFDRPPVAPERLRAVVRRLDLPPLPAPLRALIAFVADWYLADPAAVLRMALPHAAFSPQPSARPLWRPVSGARPATPAQSELKLALARADDGRALSLADWARRTGASPGRLRSAAAAGLLVRAETHPHAPSAPCNAPPAPPQAPRLAAAQRQAADTLARAVADGGFQPFLLDGVTGSGKTHAYFEAIAAARAAGRQTLVLLPEIALTEPWLERFEQRFGEPPLLWHSALTPAKRRAAWRALAQGRTPVVVGARSALFLPMPRLGLIIVDEAHEPSFKQEDGVPYHARDVAVMRARFEEVPLVLASATPSLETMEQVRRGAYCRLELPDRHGGARLPDIRLIDLRRQPPERGRWLSLPLVEAVGETLARGEQALLFLNRRGYAPLTLCRACGARIRCPQCTAWMVDHRLAGVLLCHHCGHQIPRPSACPTCGAEESLVACGPGVERLAEEAAERWPDARLAIVTSDTLAGRDDARRLFARIAAGEVDLLVGTQVLAKGHDFARLTLVGVVDADLGLAGGDLRAAERSFQQLAQVAGRAGRGLLPGRAFLQTHEPTSILMQALARLDRDAFYAAERAGRERAGMPPFGRLVALIVSAREAETALEAARLLACAWHRPEGVDLWGPAPAPLAMLRGRHRQRLLLRAARGVSIQRHVRQWLASIRLPPGVRTQIDVDPQSFL